MIIECPDCATRYDIKSGLPPEGRTVRCAKCGTVWRAMPESSGEEVEAEEASWAASSEGRDETDETPAVREAHDPFAAVDDSEDCTPPEQDAAASWDETIAEEDTAFKEAAAEPRKGSGAYEADSSGDNESAGKVRWFSSFRRRKKFKEAEDTVETAATALTQPTAQTIPFPRTNFPFEQQTTETIEEQPAFDAARQAVRGVFSGLGHGGSAVTAAMSGRDNKSAALEPAEAHSGWAKRWALLSENFERADGAAGDQGLSKADRNHGINAQRERHFDAAGENNDWFAEKGDGARVVEIDPDAALREAMRAHFLPQARKGQVASSFPDVDLAEKLETHLRSKTAAVMEEEGGPGGGMAGLWSKASQDADEDTFEPEPAVIEEPVEAKDDDTAFDQRLYREIEETQEKSGEAPGRRRGGGLALAAAWGLFLCIVSGLIVGFFVFRDIIADAAPGLVPLYGELGMPVTVQPLVFESVQYEWSTSDNRPVLTVSGSVINRAHRAVRVPAFFITVKDRDPALDREYSANLRVSGSKIRSNERADFDIELVSPNSTVTAIELELRNVR